MPETQDQAFLNRCRLKMPVSNTATCRLFATAKHNEDKLSPCPDGSIKARALTARVSLVNWFFTNHDQLTRNQLASSSSSTMFIPPPHPRGCCPPLEQVESGFCDVEKLCSRCGYCWHLLHLISFQYVFSGDAVNCKISQDIAVVWYCLCFDNIYWCNGCAFVIFFAKWKEVCFILILLYSWNSLAHQYMYSTGTVEIRKRLGGFCCLPEACTCVIIALAVRGTEWCALNFVGFSFFPDCWKRKVKQS